MNSSGEVQPVGVSFREIPRRENLSYAEFARQHLFPLLPVIVTDAIRDWKALEKWKPEFFRSEFGSRTIQVEDRQMTVGEFVDLVVESSEEQPAPYLMGTGDGNYFADLFPELVGDIEPIPEYLSPNWLTERYFPPALGRRLNRGPKAEIFFGGRGASFPCIHWDSLYFHAFNHQVHGEKEWFLYCPEDTPLLYPRKEAPNQSDVDDVLDPDLEKYPRFPDATPCRAVVKAGEMLFLPAGWWHTTRMWEPSISIAINCVNGSNWKGVAAELALKASGRNPLLGLPVRVYLGFLGRWKSFRDRWKGRSEQAPDN